MGGNTNDVAFSIETDTFGPTPIHVARLSVAEALDEPYVARVELRVHDPDAEVVELLGRDVVILIERAGAQRRICGIVGSVQEGERAEDHVSVRAVVHPALFMLSLRRNTRMFQEKSTPEILEAVLGEALGEYGRSVELDLEGDYPTREYCMQYQETDLRFVSRLLEEEGIFYSFDHDGETEVMVLRDRNAQLSRAPGPDPIRFRPDNRRVTDEERVEAFSRRHAHGSTSVAIRDFDWTAAAPLVHGEKRGEDGAGRDRESYEHGIGRSVRFWSYGSRAYGQNDAAGQKTTRLEALRRDELVAVGISGAIGLAPGTTFELVDHPHIGLDGEYYVTHVRHQDEPSHDGASDNYHNRFECRPIATAHRPRRAHPKPTIPSVQTAVVTGPSGEEIHTDEHGRVKVRFHWDRENPADETSSCWVRCEQAWAGTGWGFWWLPRVGMEVVVHFVDGDPDRPLVTGCVYNGENATPYPLPDEKTKSTIKSNSSPGGGGFNELRFEDKAGSEEIYTHAQKDYNEIVLNDHTTTVHHDQANEVDNDQTQTIGNNQVETVHQNQEMTVGGNRSVHVGGDFSETVDGTETRHTVGDVTETFGANETRTVGASLTETIVGDETRSVSGNRTETVGGSHSLTIAASSTRQVMGSLTQDVGGGITETATAGYDITAVGGMTVTTGGATIWTAPGGIQLMAPGGVHWTDINDTWFGQYCFKMCWMNEQIFFPGKIELGGLAVGLSGVKCEQALFEFSNQGKKHAVRGAVLAVRSIYAGAGGLVKRVGALFQGS